MGRLFQPKVLQFLLKDEAIADLVVRALLAWPHTSFGSHLSREIPTDERTPGIVAGYMPRSSITPERMLEVASGVRVVWWSDEIHPRHQASFRVFAPLDLLALGSTHIPDVPEQTTIFPGWWSNRTGGYRNQLEWGTLRPQYPCDALKLS